MARTKRQTTTESPTEPDVFDEAIAAAQERQAEEPTNGHATNGHADQAAQEETPPPKAPWIRRFGHWRDNEAGVRIEEDRRNKLSTIYFRETPPLAALDLLADRGWVKDDAVGGYSKAHSKLRPSENREEADNTVHEVRNIVRVSKGLPPKENFYLSRA